MWKVPFSAVCVGIDASLRQAAERLDSTGVGIVLALDSEGKLAGVVTDGDVRRAVLRLGSVDIPLSTLLTDSATGQLRSYIAAAAGTPRAALLGMMTGRGIRHIPLLDESGRAVDLALFEELTAGHAPGSTAARDGFASAVVMAGGFGTRLHPLTEEVPKPMLPVGDRPLLEIIVGQLRDAGITDITLSTFYHAEMIHAHFGNGERFGVRIGYLSEDQPLGTAGALSLLERPDRPVLVLNGDILTNTDFAAMVAFHRDQQATLTLSAYTYNTAIPYGVLEVEDNRVKSVTEKPQFSYQVSAGIYVLSPAAFDFLEPGKPCPMTELIDRVLAAGQPVAAFPIREYWCDIGRVSDYLKAIKDHKRMQTP